MTDPGGGNRIHYLRVLWDNPVGSIGVLLLMLLLGMALLAPQLSPYCPSARVGRPFQRPGAGHLLGTNDIGQDILSEIIWGTRASLTIGVVTGMLVTIVGTTVGLISGYTGGIVDNLLMRFTDLVLIVPFLPLMILLAAFLGPSFYNLLLVMAVLLWARPARIIRSQVLSLRSRTYVEAAQAAGASSGRIMLRHILPGVLPLALAQFVMSTSLAILIEASLSFLGLGDPMQKSWGTILYYAQARGAFLTGAWLWWVLPPGLLITLTVMGFTLTGFALDRYVNPRLNRPPAS